MVNPRAAAASSVVNGRGASPMRHHPATNRPAPQPNVSLGDGGQWALFLRVQSPHPLATRDRVEQRYVTIAVDGVGGLHHAAELEAVGRFGWGGVRRHPEAAHYWPPSVVDGSGKPTSTRLP